MIPCMGLLTDYFIASSDAEAADLLSTGVLHLPDDELLECKGIDPWVVLGTLEGLLTNTPYAQLVDDADDVDGDVAHGDEQFIRRVRPTLTAALAAATPDQLEDVAGPWSQTEELAGSDPESLADFLHRFSELARTAVARHCDIYCWVSL